jgi:uncharacterized membrane protein YkoI
MCDLMNGGLKFVGVVLAALLAAEPSAAQYRPNIIVRPNVAPRVDAPSPNLRAKIRPSQAAAIAQGQVPGSRVVGVKLLPSGVYAVTLKTADSAMRVMVDAQTGDVM